MKSPWGDTCSSKCYVKLSFTTKNAFYLVVNCKIINFVADSLLQLLKNNEYFYANNN